jgi:hypothetical protein
MANKNPGWTHGAMCKIRVHGLSGLPWSVAIQELEKQRRPVQNDHQENQNIQISDFLNKQEEEVTLRPTVGQYVLVSSTLAGLATRHYTSQSCCLKFAVLFLWGALSEERTSPQFAVQSLTG